MHEQQKQQIGSTLTTVSSRTDELRSEILDLVDNLTDDELEIYISLISSSSP